MMNMLNMVAIGRRGLVLGLCVAVVGVSPVEAVYMPK